MANRVTFDYSKSMQAGKSGKPKSKPSITPAPDSFSFSSMKPIVDARKKAEEARVDRILNPDTSKRLSFPSLGDPGRPKPKRSDFQDKTGLDFSASMKPDGRAEKRFQAAVAQWEREQQQQSGVMQKILVARGR